MNRTQQFRPLRTQKNNGVTRVSQFVLFVCFQVIFTQFQYSDQSSLQPSALRKALANTFAKQERFQLGHMDDAAECFVSIAYGFRYFEHTFSYRLLCH